MQAAGAMIRQLRTERNYSQAGLAHGICAASYLSKIEQGQAEPSPEILDRLFQALGVSYCRDAGLLTQAAEHLAAYYESWDRDAPTETAWLEEHSGVLFYSDLCLSIQLWRCYRALERRDRKTAQRLLEELRSQQGSMDQEQQYRYLSLSAELTQDAEEALRLRRLAEEKSPCAMARYETAGVLYHLGRYSQCIETTEAAYRLAAEEGDLYVLVWASFLLGSCYAARDLAFAEKYYRRSIRLGKNMEPRMVSWAAYNLGASYLEWGQPEKALYWLTKATPVEDGSRHNLLLEQKKALLFAQLGRQQEAAQALEQAQLRLEESRCGMTDWEQAMYDDMVRFAALQLSGTRDAAYESLLRRIYTQSGEKLGFGFRKFYGRYLIDLYRSQRRYKDALAVMEETQIELS